MEVERLIVQGYAIEHQKTIIPDSTDDLSYRSRQKLAKWVSFCLGLVSEGIRANGVTHQSAAWVN